MLLPQGRRARQGGDLCERSRQLRFGLNERRAPQRPQSRLSPFARRLLDRASLGAVAGQKLRLTLGYIGKLAFQNFRDTSVQHTSRLTQQSSIGRVLNRRALEEIGRLRRRPLVATRVRTEEAVERGVQLRLRQTGHASEQGMRKPSADRGADLRHAFGRSKPVEPSHQRGMEAGGDRGRRRVDRRGGGRRRAFILGLQHRVRNLFDEQGHAIRATNNVLPDVLGQRPVTRGDMVDKGQHDAGSKSVDRQPPHMRPPDPRRFEIPAGKSPRAARRAAILSMRRPNASRLEGSAQCASSRTSRTGDWREITSTRPVRAAIVFCRR